MSNKEIEIVLNELLDEQKKQILANAEVVNILKQLLEKTVVIEKQFQPGDTPTISERVRAIQISCNNNENKESSIKNEVPFGHLPVPSIGLTVKYSYHLKAIITAIVFFLLTVVFAIKYYSQVAELSRFRINSSYWQEANLKYRFIKTNPNRLIQKAFRQTDSLYEASSQSILDSVLRWEKKRVK